MRPRQCLELLLYTAVLAPTGAWANAIPCAATRRPVERVVRDHAVLKNEYDDIVAHPHALLNGRKLSVRPAQWRQLHNVRANVHSLTRRSGNGKRKPNPFRRKPPLRPQWVCLPNGNRLPFGLHPMQALFFQTAAVFLHPRHRLGLARRCCVKAMRPAHKGCCEEGPDGQESRCQEGRERKGAG